MNNRKSYIDIMAAVLIVYMIYTHIAQMSGNDTSFCYIWSQRIFYFFMPWFYYKSGMFYKKDNYIVGIRFSAIKLLLPWILFTTLGLFVEYAALLVSEIYEWKAYIYPQLTNLFYDFSVYGNLPLWFLWSLFFVRCIYTLVDAFVTKLGWSDKICQMLVLLIGFILIHIGISYPIHHFLFNVPAGLVFYSIGNILRDNAVSRNKTNLLGVSFVFVLYVVSIFYPSIVDIHTGTLLCGNYYAWIVYSVAAIITWNCLLHFLCEKLRFNILQYVGKQSMFYYTTHWLIIFTICDVLPVTESLLPMQKFVVALFVCILLYAIKGLYDVMHCQS